MTQPIFQKAFPYQDDVLALPVTDLDTASAWYSQHFSMTEVQRLEDPIPTVIMERDGSQLGFAINGGDPEQDGAAILVTNIKQLRQDFLAAGVKVSDLQIDQRDGQQFEAFFVVAPDGLCYYFHEPTTNESISGNE